MSTHIPKAGLAITLVALILGGILFVFLNNSFGGPQIPPRSLYELRSTFDNTELLVKKSLVMTRGVQVGYVTGVTVHGKLAEASFTVWDEYRPVFKDATAQVGSRTVFGEPYIELDPGTKRAGVLESGSTVHPRPTVEPDEALQVFNENTRKHLTAGMRELARGFRAEEAPAQLGSTISGLNATTTRLREVTDAIKDQEDDIASLVTSGHVALGAIGEREESLRTLVGSGRVALEAVASEGPALQAGLDELEPLLATAELALTEVRPLLREARPVVADAADAAPRLAPVLRQLRPVAGDLRSIAKQLGSVRRAGVPTLEAALPSLRDLRPTARQVVPASRNIVSLARWIGPRAQAFGGFLGNAAASAQTGDSEGKWLRLFVFSDERMGRGQKMPPCASPEGACFNAYPRPRHAANPRPYEPGDYPRLRAFSP